MNLEIWAEYACGHDHRIVARGECRPDHLSDDLIRIVTGATTGDKSVVFSCSCGRGAAFVEIRLDGKIINRTPAAAFLGYPGAKLTQQPK